MVAILIFIFRSKKVINKKVIGKEKNLLLILVHSAACHFENREIIRQTWGKPNVRKLKVCVQTSNRINKLFGFYVKKRL